MKKVRNLGLRGQFSAFNWWCGVNEGTLDYLVKYGLEHFTARYEDVCLSPDETFARLSAFLGLDAADAIAVDGNIYDKTHICMGNKGFINALDRTIQYDNRWRREKMVQLFYRCHPRAKRMNSELVTGLSEARVAIAT